MRIEWRGGSQGTRDPARSSILRHAPVSNFPNGACRSRREARWRRERQGARRLGMDPRRGGRRNLIAMHMSA